MLQINQKKIDDLDASDWNIHGRISYYATIEQKNKTPSDRNLLSLLILYALTVGSTYIETYNIHNNFPFPHLLNNSWLILFLHGPTLLMYAKTLTTPHKKHKQEIWLHLIPFFSFLVWHYFDFISLSGHEKIHLTQNNIFSSTLFFKIRTISVGASIITYNLLALKTINRYSLKIKPCNDQLKWLKTLTITSLTLSIINILIFNLNNYLHFTSYYTLAEHIYSLNTIYIIIVGYHGLRQKNLFVFHPSDNQKERGQEPITRPETGADFDDTKSKIRLKLERLMYEEKIYLDSDLNLIKLSTLLEAKPEQVTEMLNKELNQGFYDYVNQHRIEAFKARCVDPAYKHLSILGIAYECGFSSKATFYRAFKKSENTSPTNYISMVS